MRRIVVEEVRYTSIAREAPLGPLRKALPFVLLVVIAGAVAASLVFAWRAESRSTEDTAPALAELQAKEARIAVATWGLVDRLDFLRDEETRLRPGTPEHEANMEKQKDIQNLIAAEMPALVFRRDTQDNAIIVGVDMARRHLQVIIDAADDSTEK